MERPIMGVKYCNSYLEHLEGLDQAANQTTLLTSLSLLPCFSALHSVLRQRVHLLRSPNACPLRQSRVVAQRPRQEQVHMLEWVVLVGRLRGCGHEGLNGGTRGKDQLSFRSLRLLACLLVRCSSIHCCLGSLDHGGGGHVLVQKKGGGRQVWKWGPSTVAPPFSSRSSSSNYNDDDYVDYDDESFLDTNAPQRSSSVGFLLFLVPPEAGLKVQQLYCSSSSVYCRGRGIESHCTYTAAIKDGTR